MSTVIELPTEQPQSKVAVFKAVMDRLREEHMKFQHETCRKIDRTEKAIEGFEKGLQAVAFPKVVQLEYLERLRTEHHNAFSDDRICQVVHGIFQELYFAWDHPEKITDEPSF